MCLFDPINCWLYLIKNGTTVWFYFIFYLTKKKKMIFAHTPSETSFPYLEGAEFVTYAEVAEQMQKLLLAI